MNEMPKIPQEVPAGKKMDDVSVSLILSVAALVLLGLWEGFHGWTAILLVAGLVCSIVAVYKMYRAEKVNSRLFEMVMVLSVVSACLCGTGLIAGVGNTIQSFFYSFRTVQFNDYYYSPYSDSDFFWD